MPDYVPGLEGVVAAQTEISLVDGANGRLVYRGYVIADLAEEMSFEEVAHLFWFGHLPNRPELDGLAAELSGSRSLTQAAAAALDALPTDADPMDVLRSVVSVQGVPHRLEQPNIPAATHVTASFPTMLAAFHRRRQDLDPRAKILNAMCQRLNPKFYDLASRVEETALAILHEEHPERPQATNVEFYSAGVLQAIGLPKDLFPPTFAVARVAGWSAHVLEQASHNRLIRPQSEYIGPEPRKPVPLSERS